MEIATNKKLVNAKEKQIGKVRVDVWHNSEMTVITPRPVILMIHGMFGGGWYFESWAKFLCENGHFIVYIPKDLHEGEDLKEIDFYTYVQKLIKVIEVIASKKQKVVILGHSMGGLIAQKIAEIKPELVDGLVLVASAPPEGISVISWSVTKAIIKRLIPLIFNLPFEIDRKSSFKLLLNWSGGDDDRKEQIFKKLVPESSRVAKQLAFSRISVDHRKFDCRILVVAGGYDKLLPLEIQIKISQKYNSELRSFRKGHMLMLEDHNDEIIGAIYTWIITHFVY